MLSTPKSRKPKSRKPKSRTPKSRTPKSRTPKSRKPKSRTPKSRKPRTPKSKTPKSARRSKTPKSRKPRTPKSARRSKTPKSRKTRTPKSAGKKIVYGTSKQVLKGTAEKTKGRRTYSQVRATYIKRVQNYLANKNGVRDMAEGMYMKNGGTKEGWEKKIKALKAKISNMPTTQPRHTPKRRTPKSHRNFDASHLFKASPKKAKSVSSSPAPARRSKRASTNKAAGGFLGFPF